MDLVVLLKQLLNCCGPTINNIIIIIKWVHLTLSFIMMMINAMCRDQEVDLALLFWTGPGTHLKAALSVLFFLTNAILTRPSHSYWENKKKNTKCISQKYVLYNNYI